MNSHLTSEAWQPVGAGEARLCWPPPVWEASFPGNQESAESQAGEKWEGRLERKAVAEIPKQVLETLWS